MISWNVMEFVKLVHWTGINLQGWICGAGEVLSTCQTCCSLSLLIETDVWSLYRMHCIHVAVSVVHVCVYLLTSGSDSTIQWQEDGVWLGRCWARKQQVQAGNGVKCLFLHLISSFSVFEKHLKTDRFLKSCWMLSVDVPVFKMFDNFIVNIFMPPSTVDAAGIVFSGRLSSCPYIGHIRCFSVNTGFACRDISLLSETCHKYSYCEWELL